MPQSGLLSWRGILLGASLVTPDITRRHEAVNVRTFVLQAHHVDELVAPGTLSAQATRCLEADRRRRAQRARLRRHPGRRADVLSP